MSITVQVDDPKNMISSVELDHQTDDVVILLIDMNFLGKRAESTGCASKANSATVFYSSDPARGDAACSVTVEGLPFTNFFIIETDISRHVGWVTFLRRPKKVEFLYQSTK
jgi:hypothetical protein